MPRQLVGSILDKRLRNLLQYKHGQKTSNFRTIN